MVECSCYYCLDRIGMHPNIESMGGKPASWIIWASIKTSISPIPQHKIASTSRTYTCCYFVVIVLLGCIYIAHMGSVIYLLSDILLRKKTQHIAQLYIGYTRNVVALNGGQQLTIVYHMVHRGHIINNSTTCKHHDRYYFQGWPFFQDSI